MTHTYTLTDDLNNPLAINVPEEKRDDAAQALADRLRIKVYAYPNDPHCMAGYILPPFPYEPDE